MKEAREYSNELASNVAQFNKISKNMVDRSSERIQRAKRSNSRSRLLRTLRSERAIAEATRSRALRKELANSERSASRRGSFRML